MLRKIYADDSNLQNLTGGEYSLQVGSVNRQETVKSIEMVDKLPHWIINSNNTEEVVSEETVNI
jgi:hypothetical protein